MRVLVYEVVAFYEVDVAGDGSLAMRDAIARVERGDVQPSQLEVRHIAFPAASKLKADDPREILRRLIGLDVEVAVSAAKAAGVFNLDDPNPLLDRAGWLSAVMRRAIAEGRVAALIAALP
jgi:hypothetical protein